MAAPSQKFAFDNRLLTIEEQFRQRRHDASRSELKLLTEKDFSDEPYQLGLFLSLKADAAFCDGDYRKALELGNRSAKLLASYPLNRRYGRVLHLLSKTYSATGDLRNAEIKAGDALASYRRASDAMGQVDCLNELARISFISSRFKVACQYLDDAIDLARGNHRKVAQLTGNAARIRILLGDWVRAETDLNSVIKINEEQGEEISLAINLLSLGYLHMRRREHVFADRSLERAAEIIDRLGLKRERVIYLEYAGEMALEKGDTYKAKSLLNEAWLQGRLLAPESSLVSQAGRRLAEVELALDNLNDAMSYGQKALDLAVQIGEQVEIGMARSLISRVFAARGDYQDALEYGHQAVEIARSLGDPVDLARGLLTFADTMQASGSDEQDRIRNLFDEASRIFKKLHLEYWLAETEYRAGMFACQNGNLSRGFRKLNRSERIFIALGETACARKVHQFLTSLADQAVALSVSEDNEFKLFGKLIKQADMDDLKAGPMGEILGVLLQRTGAERAIIVSPDAVPEPLTTSFEMTASQSRKFTENFSRLIGEEIATDKPTLRLDCRRDPYINDLFPDIPDVVASVLVVPFVMSDKSTSFVYLDKLSIDSMLNPFSQDALNFTVGFSDLIAFKSAELQRLKLLEDNRRLKAQLMEEAAFPNIITKSPKMLELLSQVRQVVDSNISITIEGETGCGKDLLARAIHYNSNRRDKRFISVNCAALPETLLESELFGYRRGAFTGADRDKPGLFEEADGGTFFLDEIADMPLSVQAKILRVLEEKEVVRLGDSTPRKVDVRVLSATNKDLKIQMAQNLFRQDLFYRLAALSFRLPTLGERKEDIPLLVKHFLGESGKSVSADAMSHLVGYSWPGNVRELQNEIKKLVLLAGNSDIIDTRVLSQKTLRASTGDGQVSAATFNPGDDVTFSERYSLYDYLAAHERRFIIKALKERKGVKKHAAAMLNIPESTLRLKIKEYDIDMKRLDQVN